VPQDFTNALLAALAEMAVLSPRRQADVAVASLRAGLNASPDLLSRAVDILYREGCIEQPLHLSDGGILASVTMRGIEVLSNSSHRHVIARMAEYGSP
jgi:hypothetical protein